MRSNIFNFVRAPRVGRSVFNLSYEKKFDCDLGQLIPIMCDEVVPGDFFNIENETVIRFNPLVAPIMHEVNVFVHYFFVAYRNLWNQKTNDLYSETGNWEDFITGGDDGDNADTIPLWSGTTATNTVGTLWDYLGFPLVADCDGYLPIDLPRRSYYQVYDEFYRNENLQLTREFDDPTNDVILNRNWEKDYFTSSLPDMQKGTAVALPISGQAEIFTSESAETLDDNQVGVQTVPTSTSIVYSFDVTSGANRYPAYADLSSATTFDVSDLRLAFQIQRFMERNMRSGNRYTEFLKGHFNVHPRDERLMRPEFIGGSRQPVIISEVLQTESSDATTPQGTLAGHGISVGRQFCGRYHVKEFGLILGILSVMPRTLYQQGINRQWLRETRYDFCFPEFVNLSEQAVETGELWVENADSSVSETLFGYQGRYNEMRFKPNMVCGNLRDTLDYWHISRQFSAAPVLNSSFITCSPRKDFLAVPSEPAMIVSTANIIKAVRPIPIQPEPGLIDH